MAMIISAGECIIFREIVLTLIYVYRKFVYKLNISLLMLMIKFSNACIIERYFLETICIYLLHLHKEKTVRYGLIVLIYVYVLIYIFFFLQMFTYFLIL